MFRNFIEFFFLTFMRSLKVFFPAWIRFSLSIVLHVLFYIVFKYELVSSIARTRIFLAGLAKILELVASPLHFSVFVEESSIISVQYRFFRELESL